MPALKAFVVLVTLAGFCWLAHYSQGYAAQKEANNTPLNAFVARQLANYHPPKCEKDDWLCDLTYYKPYRGKNANESR